MKSGSLTIVDGEDAVLEEGDGVHHLLGRLGRGLGSGRLLLCGRVTGQGAPPAAERPGTAALWRLRLQEEYSLP